MFGLPGQISRSALHYAILGDPSRFGGIFRGEISGFELDTNMRARWEESQTFQFIADAVAKEAPTEGERRALLGVQLLDRAILEQESDMKLFLTVVSLEAMILERQKRSQTLTLARRLAFLGCATATQPPGCMTELGYGCPLVKLDPGDDRARKSLYRIVEMSGEDVMWLCSRWMDILHWYDIRSDLAHGGQAEVSERDASRVAYSGRVFYALPALNWLGEHPADPIGDLDRAMAALPDDSHDWPALIQARTFPDMEDEATD